MTDLTVSGSRFWHLTMEQVPPTVEKLYLTEHSNLQPNCIKGMDNLINLTDVHLDFEPFAFHGLFEYPPHGSYHDMEDIVPIPDLPKLTNILFKCGVHHDITDLKKNWIVLVMSHPLFKNIQNRIKSVNFDGSALIINLKNL